jgi:hypothetical protein
LGYPRENKKRHQGPLHVIPSKEFSGTDLERTRGVRGISKQIDTIFEMKDSKINIKHFPFQFHSSLCGELSASSMEKKPVHEPDNH